MNRIAIDLWPADEDTRELCSNKIFDKAFIDPRLKVNMAWETG